MESARARTLVVTLDAPLIQQVRTALEQRGGIVSACTTADGAVDEVVNQAYALVVISAEIPDHDSFELASRLKELDPRIKILVVGDDQDGRSIERSIEAGAEGFIHRPVRGAELLARLRDAMGTTWFDLERADTQSVVRDPETIVAPRTSISPQAEDTGFQLSVEDHDPVAALDGSVAGSEEGDEFSSNPLGSSDFARSPVGGEPVSAGQAHIEEAEDELTQDLPALNIEEFDEDNPVSIPVRSDVTAHSIAPVRGTLLGPKTGEFGTMNPADAIEKRIDQMLEPEGKLTQAINDAVGDAIAKALAKQLPAVLAAIQGVTEK